MDLGERKLKILSTIVETYVETGEPVSSKTLSNSLDFTVSPATIRNEMAELAELGFLEQPHTSAGRIPSHSGYRLYINKLMNHNPISIEDKNFINSTLSSYTSDPEYLLTETSQILAQLTKFIAVSTAPVSENTTIRLIQFVQTGKRSAMLVLMTSSGIVKNKLFRCDYNITPDILRAFYNILNSRLYGTPVSSITPAFIQTFAVSVKDMAILMPSVLEALLDAAKDCMVTDISLNGQTNLLSSSEFEIEDIKKLMNFFNRRCDIAKLFQEKQRDDINVLIGSECERPELAQSSVIIAKYKILGKEAGSIGIIGPTRMNYSRIISSLEYLTSSVEDILEKILDT